MTELNHDFLDSVEEYGPVARSLSMCLRPTFCAEHEHTTLVWGDWSSIEARKLPWLADNPGSREVLDVFRRVDADPTAPDIYMIAAGVIQNVDPQEINARIRDGKNPKYANNAVIQAAAKEAGNWRQGGKVSELSLGFGGSVGALSAMATGYGLYFEEQEAQRIVNVWRDANGWAKRFWDELTSAFIGAYENPGTPHKAGRITYVHDTDHHGGTTFCILPCGRILTYPDLRWKDVERTNRKGETYTQKTLTYRKGYKRGYVWHGILAENPTQASAASVLRAKLRVLEGETQKDLSEGYDPLLYVRGHTHDEIINECDLRDLDEAKIHLKAVMDEPLSWTEGLPLVSEISSHWSYTKAVE